MVCLLDHSCSMSNGFSDHLLKMAKSLKEWCVTVADLQILFIPKVVPNAHRAAVQNVADEHKDIKGRGQKPLPFSISR